MIKAIKSNLFKMNAKVVIVPCDTLGTENKYTRLLRKKYPRIYTSFTEFVNKSNVKLGEPFILGDEHYKVSEDSDEVIFFIMCPIYTGEENANIIQLDKCLKDTNKYLKERFEEHIVLATPLLNEEWHNLDSRNLEQLYFEDLNDLNADILVCYN